MNVCPLHDQEENKILDKMHRQKVAEVEKLTQTVRELEEAVLAGGAAANAVRDYQRKFQEMSVIYKYLSMLHAFFIHFPAGQSVTNAYCNSILICYFTGGKKNY